MNKTLYILFFCCIFHFLMYGQQVPFYNHNILNPFLFNPAQAGESGDLNAYMVRNQRYNGFGNGANNNYLSLDGNFFIPNSGFGLLVSTFSHGIQQQINGQFTYSYRVKINEDNQLGFGVAVGFLENHLNNSAINVSHLDDPYLEGLRGAAATYDFNAGISYRFKNTRAGIAVPQLIGNQVNFYEQDTRGYYALARHFMGTLEHDFFFLEDKIKLKPHFMARYVQNTPFQYDGSVHIEYENVGWFSATYKSDYAIQFNLGFRVKNSISIGYSYEYVYGSLSNFFSGVNHEFMLGYRIPSKKAEVKNIEDPKLREENEELQKQIKNQEAVNDELRRKLRVLQEEKEMGEMVEDNDQDDLEPDYGIDDEELKKRVSEIRDDTYYNFIELNGSKAANGYYVISGVFSEQKNKNKQLSRIQVDFPDAYVIKNTVNGYFYVVIDLTQSVKEAFLIKDIFQEANPESSVWMLRYTK